MDLTSRILIKYLTLPISILTLLSSAPLQAEERGRIGISAHLNNKPSIYNTSDNIRSLGLSLQYRGEKFNIDDESISYKLTDSEKFQFEVLGKVENVSHDSSDDKLFKGMENRDPSLDLGARAAMKTQYGLVSLEATGDVTNTHNGYAADLRFGPEFYHKPKSEDGEKELIISGLAGLKWQNKDIVDYYYGVKSSEATIDRNTYKGESALTPYIGIDTQMNITEHFSINGRAIYKNRPDEITDSPLVSGNDVEVTAELTYWF